PIALRPNAPTKHGEHCWKGDGKSPACSGTTRAFRGCTTKTRKVVFATNANATATSKWARTLGVMKNTAYIFRLISVTAGGFSRSYNPRIPSSGKIYTIP